MQIEFSRAEFDDITAGLRREWLITNGLGGYASGTINGLNTRRYHSLLVAGISPLDERINLLPRLDESVFVGGQSIDLATAEFADGTIYPAGYRHLESFVLEEGVPAWSYNVNGHLLRRTVSMMPGHNITVLRYKLLVGSGPVELALRPLCAARNHHALQHGSHDWQFSVQTVESGIRVQASPDAPALWLLAKGAAFAHGGDWYWQFLLREERTRGYDFLEDLYQPGTFRVTLMPGSTLTFLASAEDPETGLPDPDVVRAVSRTARARNRPVSGAAGSVGGEAAVLTQALALAAAQFIVRPPQARRSAVPLRIIAGYPWFGSWGRDNMIALPGLLLSTGRVTEAEAVLRHFASYTDQGMIPNRFTDQSEAPEYNTADATLWFFQALRATLAAGGREALLTELYPRLKEMIDWHIRGTRFGIGVDAADGLLRAGLAPVGAPPTQVTWMDARFRDEVFTPRVGKPVEINALWIDALDCMAAWAPRCGDDAAPYERAAGRAASSFAKRFWFRDGGYLFDVVDGPQGDDSSLRPNQVIALAGQRHLVSPARARKALKAVTAQLLTPYGLRTLAPSDPAYVGHYHGGQYSRDRAYHQGTVWPWLLGPYLEARRRAGLTDLAPEKLFRPFVDHLRDAGLGCISEVFAGDAPHAPGGCIQQAWSVAELLRVVTSIGST